MRKATVFFAPDIPGNAERGENYAGKHLRCWIDADGRLNVSNAVNEHGIGNTCYQAGEWRRVYEIDEDNFTPQEEQKPKPLARAHEAPQPKPFEDILADAKIVPKDEIHDPDPALAVVTSGLPISITWGCDVLLADEPLA